MAARAGRASARACRCHVTDLYISPDGTLVRAATFGRGFWELHAAAADQRLLDQRDPTTVTVLQGGAGTTTVSTAVTAGSAQTVGLTATGLPAGATADFNPTSVTAGASRR